MAPGCVIHAFLLSGVRIQREGLAALIDGTPELRVAGVGATADEAIRSDSPDVIVVDAGTQAAAFEVRMLARRAGARIVAFAVPRDEALIVELAEAGTLCFVGRDAGFEELVEAIRSAARGEARVPPSIATTLLQRLRSPEPPRRPPADLATLTVRERQIVEIIAEGLTNKEIAARLSIEVATVKNHVHNILEKLQVSRRTDAVARLRLVEPAVPGAQSDGIAQAAHPVRSMSA